MNEENIKVNAPHTDICNEGIRVFSSVGPSEPWPERNKAEIIAKAIRWAAIYHTERQFCSSNSAAKLADKMA